MQCYYVQLGKWLAEGSASIDQILEIATFCSLNSLDIKCTNSMSFISAHRRSTSVIVKTQGMFLEVYLPRHFHVNNPLSSAINRVAHHALLNLEFEFLYVFSFLGKVGFRNEVQIFEHDECEY